MYPADVKLIWPITKVRGKPRKHHVPDIVSIAAENMLASAKWKTVSWRSGTKGRLKARFAALRVRTADGPPQRIWDKGQQHLPGDEAWLIGEQRASGEKKYYLANLPATTDLRTLAATIKARCICEQAHQQLKEELGLDHFEGRSWQGLHRHALMTMIAYAFLQQRRLAYAGRKKRINGPPPQPTMPAVRHAIVDLILRPPSQQCPHCRKKILEKQRPKTHSAKVVLVT
ncbi:DNA-directed RNA polymerase subunit RPC12/RpoP [Bradyrhizobium sp. RT4b]